MLINYFIIDLINQLVLFWWKNFNLISFFSDAAKIVIGSVNRHDLVTSDADRKFLTRNFVF